MAVIKPFTTTAVTTVANMTATEVARLSGNAVTYNLGAPTGSELLFYQRVYGVTINISDDGVEQLDVLTTVNLA